jgi:LPS O-antigen subunit length determinant protein (WzzB/FepE family)
MLIIYPEVEMSYDERKSIFDNIKQLSKPEQEEIYRILRKTKETYTENSNGIFFDLSAISDDAFSQMKEYLQFCSKTHQEHEDRLKELEHLRTRPDPEESDT